MAHKLTSHQERSLALIRGQCGTDWFTFDEKVGELYKIDRLRFTLETLFKYGQLERRMNTAIRELGAWGDNFWQYRVKLPLDILEE